MAVAVVRPDICGGVVGRLAIGCRLARYSGWYCGVDRGVRCLPGYLRGNGWPIVCRGLHRRVCAQSIKEEKMTVVITTAIALVAIILAEHWHLL